MEGQKFFHLLSLLDKGLFSDLGLGGVCGLDHGLWFLAPGFAPQLQPSLSIGV